MAEPRTAAGQDLLHDLNFDPHQRQRLKGSILAIEAEAAASAGPSLDVDMALRVMDKIIEIHDCRDPDMGVPCSFHVREHRLLADIIYEESQAAALAANSDPEHGTPSRYGSAASSPEESLQNRPAPSKQG